MNGRHDEIASAVPADLDSLPRLRGFRLRGMEMRRLETFIDAAFAFAISMLVIAANQVPDNIEELLGAFRHVPAFVASIVVLGIFFGAGIGNGAGVTDSKMASRFSSVGRCWLRS